MRILFALVIGLMLGCVSQEGKIYSEPELKYLLLDHYGEEKFFFCDPDYYPIPRENETEKAVEMFPQIQADGELFGAITGRKGISAPYSDEDKLAVYREFKKLRAIQFEARDSAYSYGMQIGDEQEGYHVSGTISRNGQIYERSREKAFLTCPICLSGKTMIETPYGEINVKELRQGMVVLGPGPAGSKAAVQVIRVSKTPVPASHKVVHLVLSDGREVYASSGHPTIDGRTLGGLSSGDRLDGAIVVSSDMVQYDEEYTYDILTEGSGYFANGILLGSTLEVD